jgi:hypothetical protein
VEEIAQVAPWDGPDDPGEWVKLSRSFSDGHTEEWWALEAECRPFGKEKQRRLVVATTDPAKHPDLTTWYPGDQPAGPRFFEGDRKRVDPSRGGRGSDALLLEKLDRAELRLHKNYKRLLVTRALFGLLFAALTISSVLGAGGGLGAC